MPMPRVLYGGMTVRDGDLDLIEEGVSWKKLVVELQTDMAGGSIRLLRPVEMMFGR